MAEADLRHFGLSLGSFQKGFRVCIGLACCFVLEHFGKLWKGMAFRFNGILLCGLPMLNGYETVGTNSLTLKPNFHEKTNPVIFFDYNDLLYR
jgi:hypothetical protein